MAPMDQAHKHKCKFCSKSFPCGRSLCGHMRSHVSSIGDHSLSNGYELRVNPKKTWRLSHHDGTKKESSWSCGSSGSGGGDGAAHSDIAHARVRVPKKKRQPRRPAEAVMASSPSVSDKEQEDVAISLMMLPRDVGYWGCAESSDKNSAVFDEFKKPKSFRDSEFDESDSESRKSSCVNKKRTRLDGVASKKSRYECSTCKKRFHSYQALGGHRTSHKRLKGCCGGESSLDTDNSVDQRKNQCSICWKVFASGQALGGHKRTHLAMTIAVEEEAVVVTPDLLDLNLPALVEADSSNGMGSADADDGEFGCWWAGCDLKREAMVGMIANR